MDENIAGLLEVAKFHSQQIGNLTSQVEVIGIQLGSLTTKVDVLTTKVDDLTSTVASLAEDIRFMQDVHYDFQIQHNRMEQRYLKQNSDMLALRKDFATLISVLREKNII
jgi:outer membrane murein-binding lipoprotein Lpp